MQVMSAVRALARDTGVTVCATIHSPSAFCFNLFDSLLVLVRGQVVYAGSNGPGMIEFLQQTAPPQVMALLGQDTYSNDAGGSGGRGAGMQPAAAVRGLTRLAAGCVRG
jgi:ABC-type multidrug transport system ATPase subunit